VQIDNEVDTRNMLNNLFSDVKDVEATKERLHDTIVEAFTITNNIFTMHATLHQV